MPGGAGGGYRPRRPGRAGARRGASVVGADPQGAPKGARGLCLPLFWHDWIGAGFPNVFRVVFLLHVGHFWQPEHDF